MKTPPSRSHNFGSKIKFVSFCLACAFMAAQSRAGIDTWDPQGASGNATGGTWENASWDTANQTGTASPVNFVEGDAASFAFGDLGGSASTFTVTMNTNHTVAGIFNGPLTPKSCFVTISGTGIMNFPANATNGIDTAGSTLGQTTINVVIGGSGAVVEGEGSGGLILNAANTFSGEFQVGGGGGVSFGNNSAFGTGPIVWLTGGFLQPANSSAYNIPNTMTNLATIETFSGNAGGVTFSGPWINPASGTLTLINIANNLTVAGPISGAAVMTFTNRSTAGWILSGTNTFTGNITNRSGTLTIGGSGSLGSGTYAGNITISNVTSGTFKYASSAAQTLSGGIFGSGALVQSGLGTLTISGTTNSYSGGTTISGGILSVGADTNLGALSAITLAGGTLSANNSFTLSSGRAMTMTAASTLDVANGKTLSYGGVISGAFGLTKTSAGGLTLTGTSTYSGPTTINGGSVTVSGSGVLGSGNYAGAISDAGTLTYSGSTAQILAGALSGVGSFVQNGPGTLLLSGSSPSFTGAMTVNGGELAGVTGGSAANSAVTVSGATYGVSITSSAAQWTCGNLTYNSGTVGLDFNFGYSVAPSITLAPLNVNGAATFNVTPNVTVEGGNIPVGTYPLMTWASTSGTPPSTVTLPSHVIGSLSVVDNTLYLTVIANTEPLRWAVTTGSGTWDIGISQSWDDNTGTPTFYQETTIPGDSVVFDETYITAPAVITLNSSVTPSSLTVSNSNYSYAIAGTGAIKGNAGLTKQGDSTLTVSTANTYTGPNAILGGILSVGADNNMGAAPASATVGSITLSNSTLSANTTFTLNANRGISLAANSTLDVAGGAQMNYTGIIAGPSSTLTKASPGILVIGGNNNSYGGGTIISAGVLQTGGDHTTAGTPSNLGPVPATLNPANITLAGGTLQGNNANFSFSANRGIVLLANSGLSALSGDIMGIPGPISGNAGITVSNVNTGVVFLTGTNTYTGTTLVSTGILSLQANGSLSNSSISIAEAAAFDVSKLAITNSTLGGSSFTASGSGTVTNIGTANAAVLNGTNGGSISLASLPILLNFTPASFAGDSAHPALYVTQGTLKLNGNAITVYNATATPLGIGTYSLIRQISSGGISAAGNLTVTVTGSGVAAGTTGYLAVSGTNLNLIVGNTATFSGLTNSQAIAYGTPTIAVGGNISAAGPTYPPIGETVAVTINGNKQLTTINDSTGDFSLNYNSATLPVSGVPYIINYTYAGDSTFAPTADSSTTLTVNAVPLAMTATSENKSYGQTVTFGSASTNFTSGGLVNGETIGSVTLAVSDNGGAASAAPGSYTITPSAAIGGTFNPNNYIIAYNSGTLTVGPASLTVTASNTNRFYGATNPVFTATYTGFVNGETLATSDVGGSPDFTTSADTNSPVGLYVITNNFGTLTSTNYSFVLVNGNLTVTNAILTVTNVVADDKTYDGTTNATIDASGAGLVGVLNGDAVTLNITGATGGFADKNVGVNKTVFVSGLALIGDLSTNYSLEEPTTTASITALPITVTAASDTKTYDGTTGSSGTPTITTGSLAPGDTVTWTQSFDTRNVGARTLTPSGTIDDGNGGNNYAVTFATASGSILVLPITVTAATDSKTYDGTAVSSGVPTIMTGSLGVGDSVTWTQTFDSRNVGTRTLTPAGTVNDGNGGNNYAVTFSTAGGSISALPITVTAVTDTKTYDGTTASTGVPVITLGALAVGDTVTWTQSFNSKNVGARTLTPAGTVNDGNGGNNYAVTSATASGSITAATLTVTADNYSRSYGAPNPIFTVTYTNLVNGETLATSDVGGSSVLTTDADTNSPVGDYVITNSIGTLTSTNYSFALVDGTLTITNALSATLVTASTNPALPGADVTFTATLSTLAPSLAVPGGSVQFVIDGSPYGAPVSLVAGQASTDSATLTHGYHTIEADYAGDTNIVGSTNSITELINTPPVADTATYGRQANVPLTILISDLLTNAADADGDAISLVSVSSPSVNGATITTNAGSAIYTQAAVNPNVVDSFNYTVADIFGATNTGTVNVTILPNYLAVTSSNPAVQGDGSTQICFVGIPGFTYLIQAATDLTPPVTWTTLGTNVAAADGSFCFTDLTATNYPVRFYRTTTP